MPKEPLTLAEIKAELPTDVPILDEKHADYAKLQSIAKKYYGKHCTLVTLALAKQLLGCRT